ncbi:long-chain-acyl-CoA synthetase [Phenylobacterium immobile]|uniref:long-chain-acyl-CoA synthetase n=1 Tax=Phenylobacterium immobile TaxID=21 RepID=UPI000A99A427|nr:long-chain-acyl-CoA synthetase [Phenylobacterium immobile]
MGVTASLKRDWRFLRGLLRTLRRVGSAASDSDKLICDDLEAAVAVHRSRLAIRCEGHEATYGQLDEMANRYASWARNVNLARGQTVALFAANRLEYLAIWYGLSKVGVVTALINNQLAGAPLAHCLSLCGATQVIVDIETAQALQAVREGLARPIEAWTLDEPSEGFRDLKLALRSASAVAPHREVRAGLKGSDTALLIFTSGTTGLPKAARITHVRAQLYMRGFAGATGARAEDRIYVALPLYHATGGLCAMGAALLNGGSVVLRKKFSVSHFWEEVIAEDCTMFVYIGELCRYLVNHPEAPEERRHKIRMAFGNGLRPDIWSVMTDRFAIPEILEFYGATEGNVSLFNFDGKPGAVGRAPAWLRSRFNVRLVAFDVETETPVRGPDGFCIECKPGEVGECIGEIGATARSQFAGYADKAASEKKVLRDVFRKGDAWFATGDLMRGDSEGYLYFVDRVGDTFRWKGENVSTNEVAERLMGAPGVLQATVYGVAVPGAEGRAGMAGLVVEPAAFSTAALADHVARELPGYAQPMFIRLLPAMDTTGTFKIRKLDLVNDGYDPASTNDPLFFHDGARGYSPLTPAIHAEIAAGAARL